MKLLNKIKRKIDKKENISKAKKSSKRKTLFKDFDEIVKRGNEEEIKNVILMLMEVMTKQMHCLLILNFYH